MEEVKSQSVVLFGRGDALRTFLSQEEDRSGPFELSLSPDDDEGSATAILRFSTETPYRAIGGLMYHAPRANLRVLGWALQPPLCSPNPKRP